MTTVPVAASRRSNRVTTHAWAPRFARPRACWARANSGASCCCYGVEDTRQAVVEARRQGLIPFCITIDKQARDYLPHMFGAHGYTLIRQPEHLPLRLPQLYRQLTERQ